MEKFVIIAESRSGYQFLATLLNSNPKICCFGEIFGSSKPVRKVSLFNKSGNIDPVELNEDPVQWLNKLNAHVKKNGFDAVGFKLNYVCANNPEWKHLWDHIRDDGFKIIHLRRENLLNRYLSQKLARKEENWNWGVYEERIKIPCKEFLWAFRQSYKWQEDTEAFFSKSPTAHVWYEDLETRARHVCFDVQKFIGVKPKFKLTSPMPKQRKKSQSYHLDNYKEIYSCLLNEFPEFFSFMEDIPLCG